MKKLAFTTAIALAFATTAYAQNHHPGMAGGGGGGGGFSAQGPRNLGGGGPSAGFIAPRGPSSGNMMGPNHGPTGNLYNRGPAMNTYNRANGENYNKRELTQRGPHQLYNRYEGNRAEGNHVEGRPDHRGVVSGNFFEHGRHFRFRRFFNGEWVFLTDWNDCTAWAWVHVAPGLWAWRPVDICIG
jgi:hypothetical protein